MDESTKRTLRRWAKLIPWTLSAIAVAGFLHRAEAQTYLTATPTTATPTYPVTVLSFPDYVTRAGTAGLPLSPTDARPIIQGGLIRMLSGQIQAGEIAPGAITGAITGPANEVLATPNGSSGTSALRALVPADLPVATASSLGIARPDNTTISISNGIETSFAPQITVATTPVISGSANALLYDNGGTLGAVTTGNNGVLVTSGAGAPSISAALPSGLSAPSFTVTGAFTATGLVSNADLANPATTVNGQTCTLGLICTVSAAATTITPGTTTVTSGTPNGLLYDNGGTLGNLATVNNGVLVTSGTGVPSISTSISGLAGITGTPISGSTGAFTTLTGAVTATGGSASTSLAIRFGRTLNVVDDFGADPTGGTDSEPAIASAITAACTAGGGIINFPPGTYKIGSTVIIGNGSSSAASTCQGVLLVGQINPMAPAFGFGLPASGGPIFKWTGAAASVVQIDGPLTGWGLQNITIDCQSTASATGLTVISAQYGDSKNLTFQNCASTIVSTAVATKPSGVTNIDSLHNRYQNIAMVLPAISGASGLTLTGNANGNTDYNDWSNIIIDLGGTTNTVGVDLAAGDSNVLKDVHIFGCGTGSKAVEFDYSVASVWPAGNSIVGIDPGGNCPGGSEFANNGSAASATANYIYGMTQTNGATCAFLSNLIFDHCAFTWTPVLEGDGTAGTPTYTTQVGTGEMNGWNITVRFNVAASAVGGATGNFVIAGQPIDDAGIANDYGGCSVGIASNITLDAGYTQYTATERALHFIFPYEEGSLIATKQIPVANYTPTFNLQGSCSYQREH